MLDNTFVLPANLSESLANFRKNIGLKQADVAKKMGVDTSRVSRIETGEIVPNESELSSYCDALGSYEANDYLNFLIKEKWEEIKKPPYNHPERASLRKAHDGLQLLKMFCEGERPQFLLGEAEMHETALRQAAEYLESTKHSVAYIGDIGVGKTTAICKQTELSLTRQGDKPEEPILEVGAGGTTVCEVRIRKGAEYAIHVEPLLDTEVYKLASDFCAGIKNTDGNTVSDNEQQSKGVSKEIERALRNMSGLTRPTNRTKSKVDEKIPTIDPLQKLARDSSSTDEIYSEFNRRLSLTSRTCREITYDPTQGISDFEWLQDNFKKINNGRHPEFSIPRRMDIVIPRNPLNIKNYEVQLVDTKGIDGTAIRPDLVAFLDDARTVSVLCSTFNQAPVISAQSLIEYVFKKNQSKLVNDRLCLLVLPRQDEALAMKDDTGENAESDVDGYMMKKEQVEKSLQNIGVKEEIPIYFFNSKSDDPNDLTEHIKDQIKKIRVSREEQIESIREAIDYLINNEKEIESRRAKEEVSKRLRQFIDANPDISHFNWQIHSGLLQELQNTHARSVWASMRREGDWGNLDVYLMLGIGSSEAATECTQDFKRKFLLMIGDLMQDQELKQAHQFVDQLRSNLDNIWLQKFINSSQEIGAQLFRPALENNPIWQECAEMYGQGKQFRKEVYEKFNNWFEDNSQKHLFDLLKTRVAEFWKVEVLDHLKSLTE